MNDDFNQKMAEADAALAEFMAGTLAKSHGAPKGTLSRKHQRMFDRLGRNVDRLLVKSIDSRILSALQAGVPTTEITKLELQRNRVGYEARLV